MQNHWKPAKRTHNKSIYTLCDLEQNPNSIDFEPVVKAFFVALEYISHFCRFDRYSKHTSKFQGTRSLIQNISPGQSRGRKNKHCIKTCWKRYDNVKVCLIALPNLPNSENSKLCIDGNKGQIDSEFFKIAGSRFFLSKKNSQSIQLAFQTYQINTGLLVCLIPHCSG